MPRAASVLIGPAEMALTRIFWRPRSKREVPHRGLESGLGHAHHVVARHHLFGAVDRSCNDAAAFGHERRGCAADGDQRVDADIVRDAEALAGGVKEIVLQVVGRGEGHRVHQYVELAVASPSASRRAGRSRHLWETSHWKASAPGNSLIKSSASSFRRSFWYVISSCAPASLQLLGDGPGDTAFVGNAEDDGGAAFEIDHAIGFPSCTWRGICFYLRKEQDYQL